MIDNYTYNEDGLLMMVILLAVFLVIHCIQRYRSMMREVEELMRTKPEITHVGGFTADDIVCDDYHPDVPKPNGPISRKYPPPPSPPKKRILKEIIW